MSAEKEIKSNAFCMSSSVGGLDQTGQFLYILLPGLFFKDVIDATAIRLPIRLITSLSSGPVQSTESYKVHL